MMSVAVIDAGRADVKIKTAAREAEYPHALRQLTAAQFDQAMDTISTRRGVEPDDLDYLLISGTPYVVGNSAARYGAIAHEYTDRRFRPDYWGVLALAALARVYSRGGDVTLFPSHAPGDQAYRDDLRAAAWGEWEIEHAHTNSPLCWNIEAPYTFMEPQGGAMNVILAEDGNQYQTTAINGGRALVIDIGGFTTDWLGLLPGGKLDPEIRGSVHKGVIQVNRDFEESFYARHSQQLRGFSGLTREQLMDGLNHGVVYGSGREYEVTDLRDEAQSILLNDLRVSLSERVGDLFPYETIILTGGGSAYLETSLRQMLDHDHIVLADDAETLQFANVRGGLKLWRLYVSQGWV